jgi:two-component system OmpR family sensor kinase
VIEAVHNGGTAPFGRVRWPEVLWAVFAAANIAVIVVVPLGETIPFHSIWVSLALIYGFRLWPLRATVLLLAAVCIGTGAAMAATLIAHDRPIDELAEVPLMASMFVAVAWHARRHQTALDALRRSGARERDFVRHASHQLRTPITVARGYAELVRAAMPDSEGVEDTDVVISELDRLSRISDRLLILATSEHVEFIAHAPVDLRRLVESTALRWTPAAPRDWRVEVEADGTVVGDADRLEAALDALIENAVKATRGGDLIAIRARAERDAAVIEVSDAGVGIAPGDLTCVFDRFWTAPNAAARGGTGLGLATVKAIAEAHGGRAEALSRAGGGTTVRMRLEGLVPSASRAVAPAAG